MIRKITGEYSIPDYCVISTDVIIEIYLKSFAINFPWKLQYFLGEITNFGETGDIY